MRKLLLFLLFLPTLASAQTQGTQSLSQMRKCVMDNDKKYCKSVITPSSYEYFDKFVTYKLMPCLPTDFVYESEQKSGDKTILRASIPAGGGMSQFFRVVISNGKIDIPESFHVGFGENWQNKIQMSEQIFLMMKQNMGDKLTCDMLTNLLKPNKNGNISLNN